MLVAEGLFTHVANKHTRFTTAFLADAARCRTGCSALAVRTLNQTVAAIGPAGVKVVEAGAKPLATARTGDKTEFAKTLTAGATVTKVNSVLLAPGAADGASGADQFSASLTGAHMVGAQMAVALAHTTVSTLGLAPVADLIATDWAGAHVFGAGSFAAGPTALTAGVTVFLATGWARNNPTPFTDYFQTGGALAKTAIAGDMALVVDG